MDIRRLSKEEFFLLSPSERKRVHELVRSLMQRIDTLVKQKKFAEVITIAEQLPDYLEPQKTNYIEQARATLVAHQNVAALRETIHRMEIQQQEEME